MQYSPTIAIVLIAMVSAATSALSAAELHDEASFHLDGAAIKRFQYHRSYPNGDGEHGILTYRVEGSFQGPGRSGRYGLNGIVSLEVAVTYSAPERIMRLPLELLEHTYTREQIDSFRKEHPVTVKELADAGLTAVTGELMATHLDEECAKQVLTKPVVGRYQRWSDSPVDSSLDASLTGETLELPSVWLKDLTMRVDAFAFGDIELVSARSLDADRCEMEMLWRTNIHTVRHVVCRLVRGRGLTAMTIKQLEDGATITLEEVSSDDAQP